MTEDYYKILGISREANQIDIKKAYRKQALKFHPDRNKEADAKQQFQKVNEAFETLSDRVKRQKYDCHDNNSSHHFTEYSDLFSQFFSHTPPPSSEEEEDFYNYFKSPPKSKSVKRSLNVSLDDLYTGTTKKLKVTRTMYNELGNPIKDDTILNVNIQAGWKDGTKIVFPGQGDVLPSGKQQDIEFEIKEKPHPTFIRDRYDLYTVMHITLLEALTGFKKELKRLDGSNLIIEEKDVVIEPGQERVLIDEGMPKYRSQKKGNLIIKYKIDFPKSVTPDQCEILKKALSA